MRKKRVQYILTWVAMGLLLLSGFGLMALAWNGTVTGSSSPEWMALLFVLLSASGIYLFMLAVKKAHRSWMNEMHNEEKEESGAAAPAPESITTTRDKQELDFNATARKLVRRLGAGTSLENLGEELMKNLARELEIMSGLLYTRKGNRFQVAAAYAMASPEEPYTFKEGEGLSGQAARNQQIMILTSLPEDHLKVYSGLGKAEPKYLAIVPFVQGDKTIGLLECSGYRYDPKDIESMFRILSRDLMEKLSTPKN
jgi:hypothetical protein